MTAAELRPVDLEAPNTVGVDGADGTARLAFLAGQIALLGPYAFIAMTSPLSPFAVIEVACDENRELRVSVEMPLVAEMPFGAKQKEALARLGFAPSPSSPAWMTTTPPANPFAAAALVDGVLRDVIGAEDDAIDVRHGSHEAEHEAAIKLAALRTRIEPLLTDILGNEPARDPDDDYVFDSDSTRVFVAPRAAPGLPVIVRIFAITNIAVPVTPQLGLFLANLNFTLTFGRFALDVEHEAVWFSETLLGEQFTDGEFEFMVRMVASTASEWDDRIAEMFGGFTRESAAGQQREEALTTKPGDGGYL